jgi:hypothetical protein
MALLPELGPDAAADAAAVPRLLLPAGDPGIRGEPTPPPPPPPPPLLPSSDAEDEEGDTPPRAALAAVRPQNTVRLSPEAVSRTS